MTIFHALFFVAEIYAIALGVKYGCQYGGTLGGLAGAVVGATVGFAAGKLPLLGALCYARRKLAAQSTEQLRAQLRDGRDLAPNILLLELKHRGVDINPELPFVLDMLVSDSQLRRSCGWNALASAFPKLASEIRDYRVHDPVDESRKKVQPLRDRLPSSEHLKGH